MTWVRWANFHTDNSSGSMDNGISINQYGVDIPNFSYGEVVLARVHTHPDNTCFSYEDISTFAFPGGIVPVEENNGSFSVLVTNKNIYAIEMINSEIAFSIYFQLGRASRIEKYWWSAYNSAEGSPSERNEIAVKSTINLFKGSMIYHKFERRIK